MRIKELSIGRLLSWLDDNLLLILGTLLIVFIPLYPKWPLFDILPGYIVRVRLEDLLVAFTVLVWLIWVLRKKVSILPNPLLVPIGIYIGVGFVSSLSAIFITRTVPFQLIHIAKLFLHFFRRIEYFSLFFIFYSALRNLGQIRKLVVILGATVFLISIYGFGQKYLYWPVYSTMNREFSKGWRLVLTEHARVPSTFAGHYDLAAYLAFFLVIFVSLAVFLKNKTLKIFFSLIFITGFLVLILTASRTSFIAYLVSVSLVIFLLSLREKKRLWWAIPRWVFLISFSLLIMFSFGDLSERFSNFFKVKLISDYAGSVVREKIFGIQEKNLQYLSLNQDLALVYSQSDIPPTIVPTSEEIKKELPPDVYQDIPDYVSTGSATTAGSGKMVASTGKEASRAAVVAVPRNYSQTAFVVGLSSAIRFDALWPMAIKGFLRNPLLGSGYSTLNKIQVSDFTEAESTDNDYLRVLGETGILGFVSFFGIIAIVFKIVYQKINKIKSRFFYSFIIGMMGGIMALLINAVYIDVFEASKIAFIFWAMIAILLISLELGVKAND